MICTLTTTIWFYTFSFSESSDDPIPYEAKATSKVQVVNFCLSLFFLGSQTKIRVPRKSWQKFFLLTKQFLLMTYRVSDPSCGTVSKYDLFCCWEIKGRERKRKRKKKKQESWKHPFERREYTCKFVIS